MNLQLYKQTFNILSEQRSVKKSSKNNMSIDVLKSDAFMINISSELTNALKIIAINLNALFKITSQASNDHEIYLNVQITQKVFASSMLKSAVQTFLHVIISKRKKDSEDQQLKDRAFKISWAMMIWLVTKKADNDESDYDASMSWALFDIDEFNLSKTVRILMLNIYKNAVQNSVWKKL